MRLEKLPMELLILLLRRQGELVSREEIADHLWGKQVYLDVEHGINTAVRKIRLALRDDPDQPRFVETVVGKGYRFAAPVTATGEPIARTNGNGRKPETLPFLPQPKPSPAETQQNLSNPQQSPRPVLIQGKPVSARWHRRVLPAGAIAVALIAAFGLMHRSNKRPAAAPPQQVIRSLAVLPLKSLSGDLQQEYFADGMTEELIDRLSAIRGLRVISRTSAMHFKDTHDTAPQIARALNVDALVEGSIIRDGKQVRITVQLIRGATDEHIWTADYDREYQGVLALQEEVARNIAAHVRVTVTRQELGLGQRREPDPQAHEDYLKGRYFFNQRTEQSLYRSVSYFRQAIARDPSYAVAYCGLADAYTLLGFRGHMPSKETLAKAKAAATKALELDDSLADAHTSLAFIAETHEWDWRAAEREYRRALELNPGDSRTLNWYAGYLMYVGRFDEGIAEARKARDLDPLSLPVNNALAGRLLVAGHYDDAWQQLRDTLQMDPDFGPAHQTLGWLYLNRKEYEKAIHEFQEAVRLSGKQDSDMLLDLGFAYATAGDRVHARELLAKLITLHKRGLAASGAVGILYGALGDPDKAFGWLDKAYDERDPELTYLKVPGRRFEPLRRDPRFRELLRRVGLPE